MRHGKILSMACALAIAGFFMPYASSLRGADEADTQPAPVKPAKGGGKKARTPRVRPAVVPFTLVDLVKNYSPVVSDANIAPTPGTTNDPTAKVEVFGEPVQSKGHPNTLWDQDDVARFKTLLKTDKVLQDNLAAIVAKADRVILEPVPVPTARKGADGKWLPPDDFPAAEQPKDGQGKSSESNASTIEDLAIAYTFTGDAKYGEYCRKMLLAYAENFPKWGRPENSSWRSAKDGRLTFQFLNDGFVIAKFAWAYDLVHDLPSFTAEDRTKIHDGLFLSMITPFFTHGARGPDYLSTRDNRSCICAAAVLMAGYATEDPDMVDFALHGHMGSKLKPIATEAVPLNPAEMGSYTGKDPGGLLGVHFSEDCLLPDGLWVEGSPAYTLSIAGAGLFDAAEILWRHGQNMYSYRNGALKRLLDSGVLLAYPNAKMDVPCLRDSQPFSLLDDRDWMNQQIGGAYFFGYERYHEPTYLPMIRNGKENFNLTTHSGPPLVKENLPDTEVEQFPVRSVNYYSTGYGVLRVGDFDSASSLLLQYGQVGEWSSHDHPSALGIDLYAFHEVLIPMPGVIFPYNDPLDPKWYHTTLANPTMEVDEDDQLYANNRFFKYKGMPKPTTPQLVFAPASTMGMQRAYTSSAYPGTTLDRSIFMTNDYVADIFGAFCTVPRTYDLAWHLRGKVDVDLPVEPMKFAEPIPEGYNALDNVRHAQTDKTWSATATIQGKTFRFLAAAGAGTDVILGDGWFHKQTERPLTILERREKTHSTIYGNVVDIDFTSDKNPFVKSVTQDGGLDAGYGLLKVETTRGTDLCFTAYRPGTYKAGGIETDAEQAMVTMDGGKIRSLYLAGGKSLKVGGASIERSEPGLAYVEKLADGKYVVSNPSNKDATVTVTGVGGEPFSQLVKAGATVELGAKAK